MSWWQPIKPHHTMITVITDKHLIKKLYKQFQDKLGSHSYESIKCWVGFPGGSFEDTVRYFPDLNIWISVTKLYNRFWNGFGIGSPIEGANNSLTGEINFPFENINRTVAGAFAEDDNGNILVLHRGKIGGGKPGIGKRYFIDNYRGDLVTANDGKIETEFCLVGDLKSKHFPKQVSNFIFEIFRVKNLEFGDLVSSLDGLGNFSYADEKFGCSITERNEPVVVERTHGLVVNALAQELKNRGFNIGNDKNRDLFIYTRGQIKTLFEIKTNSSTQCLYSVIGQLLLYSIPIPNQVNLIAVLPTILSKPVTKRFSSIGIKILYYYWEDNKPIFIDIDKIL